MVEWIIGWDFFVLQQMAPFSMYSSYSFHPFPLRQTSGGGVDASQYKAELTIGRLVSKQPLSRVWHCSETMFLNDSIAQQSPVQTPVVSMSKHKLKISHYCVSNEKVIVVLHCVLVVLCLALR